MSGVAKGAAKGFVQGAQTSVSVGFADGGLSMVIGTVWGAFAGSKIDKAEKKLKQAKALQRQRERDAYKQRLLSTLRQGRIQRASSLAAAVAANAINSSGTEAALSSIGSQIANQVEYMSVDQGRINKIEALVGSADKLARQAQLHEDLMSTVSSASSNIATQQKLDKIATPKPSSTQVYDAPIGPMQTVYEKPIGPQPLTYTYPIGPSNSMGPYLPSEYQTFTTNNSLFR